MAHEKSEKENYDVSAFLEAYRDDPEIIQEIREIFLEEAPEKINALQKAVEDGDLDRIGRICHSFANSCGTLQAEYGLTLSREAEQAARSGNAERASAKALVLMEVIKTVLNEIQNLRVPE
jgi:HPt (histidine-containing phosphotransfer) domain-containing protein